jgi:hypothetical protein
MKNPQAEMSRQATANGMPCYGNGYKLKIVNVLNAMAPCSCLPGSEEVKGIAFSLIGLKDDHPSLCSMANWFCNKEAGQETVVREDGLRQRNA